LEVDLGRNKVLTIVGCSQKDGNPSDKFFRNFLHASDPSDFWADEVYFADEPQVGHSPTFRRIHD
jgi:hypothetical protein